MAKRSSKKIKKAAWFIKVRGSYLPARWQGWLSYIPFVAFLVWTLVWAFQRPDNLSSTIIIIFPAWVAAAVVMTWLASRTS